MLATQFQLLSWASDAAIEAYLTAFTCAKGFLGPGQKEDNQIFQSISEFLARHGDSRFASIYDDKSISNRAGWYKDDCSNRIYMFYPVSLREAGCGFERSRIVEALKKADWIVDKDSDRYTKKTRTPVGVKNLYQIMECEE